MKLKTLLTSMLTTALLVTTAATGWGQELPTNWTGDTDIQTFKEATTIHGGTYSVKVVVNSGTQANCDLSSNVEIPVTAGNTFTFSAYVYSSAHVKARAVYTWTGASVGYSTGYTNAGTAGFEQFTESGTVPAGATGVKVGLRFYDQTGFVVGEVQYVDDFTFESPTGTGLTVSNGDFESWPAPDTQAPVATFDPADAATGVSSSATPTITFDEPVFAIGGAAITDPTSLITLNQTDATGTAVPFTAAIDGTSKVITVTPTSSLTPGQLYYLAIAPVQDAAGNATVAQSITFTTAATLSTETDITGFTLAGVDGTIDATNHTVSVVLPYGTAVTALEPTITLSQGATVSPTGAQDFTNPVTYTVTAEDGTTTQPWVVTVTISGITSIYDIQYTTEASGDSPKTGDNVTISGVVTSLKYTSAGAYRGFYMQDADGAWNGIYVYTSNTDYVVAPGDNVTVNGTVAEFNNLTEISPTNSVTVNSSGNAMPNPAEVTTAVASTEPYESVLVTVKNVNCASGSAGSYVVSDGSANLTVFKSLYADLTLTVGSNYDITGIIDYYSTGSMYELYPRSANDITLLTGIGQNSSVTTKAFPNPFSDNFTVNSGKVVSTVSIYNLLGQKLMERSYSATEVTVPAANLTNGIYIVNVRFQDGSAATLRMVKK